MMSKILGYLENKNFGFEKKLNLIGIIWWTGLDWRFEDAFSRDKKKNRLLEIGIFSYLSTQN